MKQPIISRSADIMGGAAVFYGTRVPVQTLLDYLEAGESIDDFLRDSRPSPASGLSPSSRKPRTGWSKLPRESPD
jgi:hypothetical protein